ncbi:MAG: isoprenyl transferase [Candidatus Omnitrophica bacterium]|nr:isoprenyl transferase [Candidatus Omnitrophota bacterium]MDD5610605.1 isoprenyl transferase [Candidatus Omnitrophota bacterium]
MVDTTNMPRHVAIIMDGNGRWAKKRGLPRIAGHREGIKRAQETIKTASRMGIKVLTLFAFSSENWQRPKREIDMLMNSLDNFLKNNIKELMKGNIRLKVIGRDEPLPVKLLNRLRQSVEETKANTGLTLCLALNYGSRQEIIDAVKKIMASGIDPKDLDENSFPRFLYTDGLPDPDLLIRTSGEQRISNFLLWQISYAELYFARKNWPEFREEEFKKAILEYQKRERRFGALA